MFQWWFASWRARGKQRPMRRSLGLESLESRNLMAASVTPVGVPQLSSRPGAAASLYLDFDGNVEAQWGNRTNVVTPAYDTDGNKGSFSTSEVAAIREIWARVAEDYAPFNLNVTTVRPARVGDRVTAKVAIGGSYSDWYGSSAGGVTYVGGFSNSASNVAYVFANSVGNGNPKYVAEAVSHEAGHLFGLDHQATWSGGKLVAEYNSGSSMWAPIMGVSYYADRTTWSRGPTSDSATSSQDDLSILASSMNGFGYVADDYGGTVATASTMSISSSRVNVNGLIGKNDDRDVFKFATNGGSVSFSLDVAQHGPNLDGVLELQNAAGQILVSSNSAASYDAMLSRTLAAGTYYLVVRSSGGYGNLGRYTLSGTVAAATTTPSSPTPAPTTPVPQPSTTPVTTTTLRVADDGTSAFAATGTWQTATGAGYASDIRSSAAGSGATSTWSFTGLVAGQYRLAATWLGSALNATDAPFAISSGSKLLSTVRVNQQRAASTFTDGGAAWQNLGTVTITGNTLTVKLSSSMSGRVMADAIRLERVDSTSGGLVP